MNFRLQDVTNISAKKLQRLTNSNWKYIRVNARLKCSPFTWFTKDGFKIIEGAINNAPHISIPSEYLEGNYVLNDKQDVRRFKKFNTWYLSLIEGTDYIKIVNL